MQRTRFSLFRYNFSPNNQRHKHIKPEQVHFRDIVYAPKAEMNPPSRSKSAFKIPEHALWASRKVRVVCIRAGAFGVMFCSKKERESGEDSDLVVYKSLIQLSISITMLELTTSLFCVRLS